MGCFLFCSRGAVRAARCRVMRPTSAARWVSAVARCRRQKKRERTSGSGRRGQASAGDGRPMRAPQQGTFATAAGGGEREQKGVAAVAEVNRAQARADRCGHRNRDMFTHTFRADPPTQPKKFLGLVPRIFFHLFTFHSSLFTFLPPQRNFFGGNK